MAEDRLKDYPNVPTTYEKGIKAKCSTTRGYAVLASTPQPIIDQISKAMVRQIMRKIFCLLNFVKPHINSTANLAHLSK